MTYHKVIGQNVRAARKTKGVLGKELAKLLEMSVPHIYNHERGTYNFTHSQLVQIAKHMNVNIELFYNGVEQAELENLSYEDDIRKILKKLKHKEQKKLILDFSKYVFRMQKIQGVEK